MFDAIAHNVATNTDDEQVIVVWLAGPRATLVLDGMEISCAPEILGGAIIITLPVLADQARIAELRSRWSGISWVMAREEPDLVIGCIRCAPTLPGILKALNLGRRILTSTSRSELN